MFPWGILLFTCQLLIWRILVLQAAAGNHFVSFRKLEAGTLAKLPPDAWNPALNYGIEVQEHDAEIQIAVDLGMEITISIYAELSTRMEMVVLHYTNSALTYPSPFISSVH